MNRTSLRLVLLLVAAALGAGCGDDRDARSRARTPADGGVATPRRQAAARDGAPDLSTDAAEARGESGPSTDASRAEVRARGGCPPRSEWPEGMACVEGGTFLLGFDAGQPDEREPGRVTVSAFYMDTHEVTVEDFERCIEARRCKRPMRYRNFMQPRQPIVATRWADAVAYCEMMGKRLPTEAEWERAAAGPEHTQYPWGDEPLGCERAVITDRRGHGCGTDVTAEVGSKPPGHWGLYDMAGNVHEWVADWYSPCLRGCDGECGDACFGENPRGPCGGAARCPGRTKRSIRGGSWYWPEERARTTARRGADPANRANHRFGFRCARDIDERETSPASPPPAEPVQAPDVEAGAGDSGPAESNDHAPPSPEEASAPAAARPLRLTAGPLPEEVRRALAALPDEDLSLPDEHYFHTNEWRHDVLEPHLRGIGGAFIGVGADQNYTMAAMAGSELLLLVDFDPRIPRLHSILEVLVLDSDDATALLQHFDEASADASADLIRREIGGEEGAACASQFRRFRERWGEYLGRVARLRHQGRPFGWLARSDHYDWVRRMFREGRIVARAGDVTGTTTLRSMGALLHRLNVPVGVLYFSNAEQFFPFTPDFVRNLASLPTTERSIVVRTTRHARLRNADHDRWHYIVQPVDDFRVRLETGAYPRHSAILSDLLAAGPPAVGREGLSVITADTVPRRQAERRP